MKLAQLLNPRNCVFEINANVIDTMYQYISRHYHKQRVLQLVSHGECNLKLSKDSLRLRLQRNFYQGFLSILQIIMLSAIRFAGGCNIRRKDVIQN